MSKTYTLAPSRLKPFNVITVSSPGSVWYTKFRAIGLIQKFTAFYMNAIHTSYSSTNAAYLSAIATWMCNVISSDSSRRSIDSVAAHRMDISIFRQLASFQGAFTMNVNGISMELQLAGKTPNNIDNPILAQLADNREGMGLFTPSESINYNFVAGVYGFFSVCALVLIGLHFYVPAVEGFYIVLVPFLPCFLWSLVVRTKWQELEAAKKTTSDGSEKEPGKEGSEEPKKDK